MRTLLLTVLAAASASAALVLTPAFAAADLPRLEVTSAEGGVELDAGRRRGGRRRIPEFDAGAAGVVGVLLGAGAVVVIARRRKA